MSQGQLQHHAVAERFKNVATLIGQRQTEPQDFNGTQVIPGLGLSTVAKPVEDRALLLEQGAFTVVAAASVSRGKSTLLNALLGQPLFPMGPQAVTGSICQVVYGHNSEEVTVVENRVARQMPLGEFTEFISLSADEQKPIDDEGLWELPERLKELDYVRLHGDTPLLAKGLRFVDTLGFNAGEQQAALTRMFLRRADAIVVALRVAPLFDQIDVDFINSQGLDTAGIRNMFFLINDFGYHPEEERRTVMEEIAPKALRNFFEDSNGQLDMALFKERVFLVNAKAALEAKKAGVSGIELEETGLPDFERTLERILDEGEHIGLMCASAVGRVLLPALERGKEQISVETSLLNIDDLDAAVTEADSRLAALESEVQRIQKNCEAFGEKLGGLISRHFRQHFLNRFVTRRSEKKGLFGRRPMTAEWHEDWPSLGIGKLLSGWEITKSAFSKEKREALSAQIATRFESYIRETADKWLQEALEDPEVTRALKKFQEDVESDIENFVLKTEEIEQQFHTLSDRQIADESTDELGKRRVRKAALVLLGVGMLDPSQVLAGASGATGFVDILRRLITEIVAASLAVFVGFFVVGGPAGWAVFIGALLVEVIAVYKWDRSIVDRRLRNQLGEKLWEEMGPKAGEIVRTISEQISRQLRNYGEQVEASLAGELTSLRDALAEAKVARTQGEAAVTAEKARLATIETLLDAELEEISQAAFGRVLTPEELSELAERFALHIEDDEDDEDERSAPADKDA